MPQLSLYLDDAAMVKLREDARAEGVSLSRYAAAALEERHRSSWPSGYFGLYGAIDDDTFMAPSDADQELDGALPQFE